MNSASIRVLSSCSLRAALPQAAAIGAPGWPGGWIELRAASTLNCAPPAVPSATPAERRLFAGSEGSAARVFRFPPRTLAWLEHARVAGDFIVVSARNEVLRESYPSEHVLQQGGRFLPRRIKLDLGGERIELPFVLERPPAGGQRCEQDAVLIGQHWHFNYHHWLIECLPRLRDALESPELSGAKLLLPQPWSAFQRDSLELLGLGPDRLLPFDGRDIEVQRLWWPSLGCFAPDEIGWLRERIFAASGSTASSGTRRLYVTRADASCRRLANEAQLWPQLERASFERVSLDAMPFADQVRLFAEAAVILGPHGAGLTNQIFAPTGVMICELMPDAAPNLCFYLLANVLGQRYSYAVGASVNAQADFTVAPARLAALLEELDLR